MQVREIAGDLDLSREEVLYFVSWLRSLPPETRESMKESREAAEHALAERKQLLQEKVPETSAEKMTFQGGCSIVFLAMQNLSAALRSSTGFPENAMLPASNVLMWSAL